MKGRVILFAGASFVVALCLFGQAPRAGQGKGAAKTAPAADAKAAPKLPPTTPADLAAVARCQTLRQHGESGERACWDGLTRSGDPAVRAEGLWANKDYKGALDAFDAAVAGRPTDANVRVRFGMMLFEAPMGKSQVGIGEEQFQDALQIDQKNARAMLGLARIAEEGFGDAAKMAEKAIETDPKLYEARELLARIALEDNNDAKAIEEANQAVAMSPEALDAMAILATADWLNDRPSKPPVGQISTTSPWIDKILKVNPHYGEAYAIAGHFFQINRRYPESILYFRKALELNPELQTARSELGLNLMRLGKDQEALAELDQAYNAGFKDEATVNTLKLILSYKDFDTFTTPTTILKIPKKESALVRPYLQAELDEIIKTYEKKYKYHVPVPVQVEAYPNHEDFAVRTMGLPGLGALGVTFDTVVAIDSPSAADPKRGPGSFHWATTLWHEMSHVYVLSMTNSRAPRWFAEGLAVYEESAIHSDWGDGLDHASLLAIKDKKLLPIAELERGYVHPSYENQVIVSYYQGGQTLTYIIQKWGYDTVLNMIHDFAENMPTPQVIEKELKIKPEEFDKQFLPWVEAKTKRAVDGFDTWTKGIRSLNDEIKAKDWDAVIKEGPEIRDIYADYVDPGSVYEALAKAYEAKGDTAKAMEQLKLYSARRGRNPDTLRDLAKMQEDAGDKRGAAATLERINYIYLRDDKQHLKLADLDMQLGNPAGAILEYGAVIALKPVDPAGAHYHLAKAYEAVHDDGKAMDEVLSSLETAPGYRDAQKLLLELNAKPSNTKK